MSALCDCESLPDHESRCELAPMTISKAGFVTSAEGGVRAAFESYKILIGMDFTVKDAQEMVIEETRESASCFAGIGSCGGGGCKH